ncbi:hypothetical protein, partial [Escherichia coli]|uniref:hypothetical protein n=1 Tax=Escherichia coli TaxID=562 RepID=UPI0028E00C98
MRRHRRPELRGQRLITLLARIEADFGARIVFGQAVGLERFMPGDAAGFPRNTQPATQSFIVGKLA